MNRQSQVVPPLEEMNQGPVQGRSARSRERRRQRRQREAEERRQRQEAFEDLPARQTVPPQGNHQSSTGITRLRRRLGLTVNTTGFGSAIDPSLQPSNGGQGQLGHTVNPNAGSNVGPNDDRDNLCGQPSNDGQEQPGQAANMSSGSSPGHIPCGSISDGQPLDEGHEQPERAAISATSTRAHRNTNNSGQQASNDEQGDSQGALSQRDMPQPENSGRGHDYSHSITFYRRYTFCHQGSPNERGLSHTADIGPNENEDGYVEQAPSDTADPRSSDNNGDSNEQAPSQTADTRTSGDRGDSNKQAVSQPIRLGPGGGGGGGGSNGQVSSQQGDTGPGRDENRPNNEASDKMKAFWAAFWNFIADYGPGPNNRR